MYRFYTILIILSLDVDKNICGIRTTSAQFNFNGAPSFIANSYLTWESGDCVQVITVSGTGVKDQFEDPCGVDKAGTFSTNDFVMVGDPSKHSLSLYKDKKDNNARLTIVRHTGCTVRSYTTTDAVTTYTESPVEESYCNALKKKMVDELEKNRLYWENWQIEFDKKMGNNQNNKSPTPPSPAPPPPLPSPPKPLPISGLVPSGNNPSLTQNFNMQAGNEEDVSSTILTVKSRILQKQRPCKQEISAVGNGVKDTFIEPCTQNGPESVNRDGIMVFGDPFKLSFSLFSEKRNTLIVVKNKVCTLKTYKTTKGVTTSTKTPMSIAKCLQIKKRMSDALKSRSNNAQQQSSLPAVPPKPVPTQQPTRPVLPYVSQPQFSPMSPQTPQTPLLPQPLTTTVPPSPASAVSSPVNNYGFVDSTTSSTVTYRPADNRVNSPKFSKTTNNYNNDGYTTREFIIAGLGLNDYFKYNTQAKLPNTVTIGNIFGLREPNGELGLFTDKWGEMWVFESGKCFKRTYETSNGQTKITSTPIKDGDCQTVRDKMTKFMGGQSAQVDLRPQPITSPVQQAPATPVSNPVPSVTDPITTPTVTYRPVDNRVTSTDVHKTIKNNFNDAQRTRELTIVGRGLNDHFKYNCPPNLIPNSATVNNIFRFTEPNSDFGLFSDTWGELWVFQNDKCSKRTYETVNEETKITSTPMKDGECATVKDKLTNRKGGQPSQIDLRPQPLTSLVQQALAATGSNPVPSMGLVNPTTSPTITYRPADNRINSPDYLKISNIYNNDGYSTHEVIIVGRGVDDYFKRNAQPNAFPSSMTSNNVFGFKEPNGEFGLFADTWGELWVFEMDKCSKRTYESAIGQRKITLTPMNDGDCSTVKGKLNNYLGGNNVFNLNGGQQKVNWNNNQNSNWNNNQNINWNNNQNINWSNDKDSESSDSDDDSD